MPYIKDDLQTAVNKRDERTIIGAVIGFFIGATLGWDGLIGILGAVGLGCIVYNIYNKEVTNIRQIQEMKK